MAKRRDREDRAWADYSKAFRTTGLPMILSSAVSLTIYGGNGTDFDVKQATELGASLLLDKPLILVCTPGAVIPSRLRRAADTVIENWDPDNAEAQDQISSALSRLIDSGAI